MWTFVIIIYGAALTCCFYSLLRSVPPIFIISYLYLECAKFYKAIGLNFRCILFGFMHQLRLSSFLNHLPSELDAFQTGRYSNKSNHYCCALYS